MSDPASEKVESFAKMLSEIHDSSDELWTAYVKKASARITIEGKSFEHWRSYFRLNFPENPNADSLKPVEVKMLAGKLGRLLQDANDKIRITRTNLTRLKGIFERAVIIEMDKELESWKKANPSVTRNPSKDFLRKRAETNLSDLSSAIDQGKATLEFFTDIENYLYKACDVITQLNVSNAHEVKADGFIPRV